MPISIVWPYTAYASMENAIKLNFNGKSVDIVDAGLSIVGHDPSGPIKFNIDIAGEILPYEVVFGTSGISFRPLGKDGKINTRKENISLSKYLNSNGLGIYFEEDTTITHSGYLLKYDRSLVFDSSKIKVIDWKGINLRKESQKETRDKDSIQARTIETIQKSNEWDLIIDDDGPGEIADIVAIKIRGQDILISLTHCKYASEGKPAARIDDLYDVCGQAQKSMLWADNPKILLSNLIRREKNRQLNGKTGIIQGALDELLKLESKAKYLIPSLTVAISQPGLSKAKISAQQEQLLACTQTYLYETYEIDFEVFASA